MEKKRILILNWRDPKHPLGGGAELYLFKHASNLKKNGHDVIWFSAFFKGAKKKEIIDGVQFIRAGSEYTVHLNAFIFYITRRFGRVDLVVDSFHGIPFFTPMYIYQPKIVGLVHEVAGKIWFVNLQQPLASIGYLLEKASFIFYKGKKFITVSKSTYKDLIKRGISEENIFIIHNGLNTPQKNVPLGKSKNPTLIFLGRVANDKGIKDLIISFGQIVKEIKNVKLHIIGREEKLGDFKSLTSKFLNKEAIGSVCYFGYVDEQKKFELLANAWILVHPSMKEGWGLNVIEAASQGTPAVGYDVEGLRDSINDGRTGILCETNSDSLTASVIELINDNKRRRSMGEAAKKWSEKFKWEESVEKSRKLISMLLES